MRDAASCNWPNPGSDEIDLTEILGSDLTSVNQQVHSANSNAGCRPSGIADVSQNFHVYDFVWSPTELVWYIDGVQTCSLSSSNISATNKYLIINVAVGGIGTVTPDPKTLPQSTYVDYVRVYSQASYPPTGTPIFDDEFGSTTRPNPPTSLQEITK
jgi:beta-glucanase (GH16 family)